MLKEKYPIKVMCELLKCSRSGYYDWVKLGKPLHKAFNKEINDLVLLEYNNDNRRGITSIKMYIKKIHGLSLTKATVYRYMRLNNIQSIIRKKRYRWGTKPHISIPNLLNRDFTTNKPNEKWSIDISYLITHERTIYLCAIKDLFDKSIISYTISRFINNNLVFETLHKAFESVPVNQRLDLILHSDQGGHFTSPAYSSILEKNKVIQSMSYKGNPVDNSPIESWFSTLKAESIYLHKKTNEKEMISIVESYIKYYNEERLQEKIKELAPIQYRKQALSVLF